MEDTYTFGGDQPQKPKAAPNTAQPPAPVQSQPQATQPMAAQPTATQYDPADANKDGIVSQIERYLTHHNSTPDERANDWVQQNVWSKGYTVDMGTGEIVDPNTGQPVGRIPSFE